MRTVKEPAVRREEIMEAAAALFRERGIDATAVSDIVKRAGVAKGTFYWHFASKETLLDAMAERKNGCFLEKILPLIEDASLAALDKLRGLAAAHDGLCAAHHCLRDYFHRPENMALHQKHRQLERETLSPLLGRIISQGVAEGVFRTSHPNIVASFMLMALAELAHPSPPADDSDRTERLEGIRDILERVLGAAPGSLSFLTPG
jgi:AcrR family transcriptional regulator